MEHTKFKRSKKRKTEHIVFELPANGQTYSVSATPFSLATGEICYRVSYANGPVHVFNWDEGLNRYAATELQAGIMPPAIEMKIAERLNEHASALQDAA